MLAKGKKTSNPEEKSGESPRKCGVKNWYENNQRSIIAVALIAIVAFVLRFIFAFDTSVSNGTALSGGTGASDHLHAIVAILDGGSFIGADGALNYPFGSTNTNPVLYDLILTPFALLGKAMGMTSVAAASAVLAWGAIIFGVLATITAYFVGKEFLGEKKHGYLAAAFIAFCPVVIANTVFSNGTEIPFVAFLFMVMSLYLIRGVKNVDSFSMPTDKFTDIFRLNKKAMMYAIISGVVFALILLSWNGFRFIANALCVVLAIMVLVDRFRKKDSRVIAVYFSIVLLIGMVAATAYYVPSGLWDAVLSGVLLSVLLSVAICLSFAALQKIPWTITIPVYAIVLIAIFAALFFLAPDYFNVIVNGNSVFASEYGSLVNITGLSLSQIATNYGFITVWFPFIMVIVMLWKLPKNINSPAYIFTIIWSCFGIGYGIVSDELAVIFAPAYALGFAYILAWLFDNVKFKEYFDAIRASDLKSVWKKLLKPIPFLSIVGVLLLICAPNALYAIDASIPSNDMENHEGLQVGALNYYIRTDSDWKVNDVLAQYSSEDKTGAMLTWTEYASDASTYGGFSVTTDSVGNGARYTSLTLLANGTDNTAVADMAINLIIYNGIDASKDALIGVGMTEYDYGLIKEVFNNPGSYREEILNNPDTYGIFSTDVSDETIIYVKCSDIMTTEYNAWQIAEFYEAMVNVTGKDVGYVMVTGDMIPIAYGGSSVFAAMAKMADYTMYDNYGTVSEFEKTDSTSMYFTMYYTGVYSYTESMTNSLLWRSYIGMSPEEAGFTGYYATTNYFNALTLSDGTVKATPGYGLANFEIDESSWYVKYNPDSDATNDSDGWVKMLAKVAKLHQEKDGGLINYLAGYPVIMKYVSNESGTKVSGTVTGNDGSNIVPVQGIRVCVVDENGFVHSTSVTDVSGKYTVVASKGDAIEFRSASSNLSDGTLVKLVNYTDPTVTEINTQIQDTKIDFKLVDSDGEDIAEAFPAKAKFVGQNSGFTATWDLGYSSHSATGKYLVPDTYDITVTDDSGKNSYATATYTVVPGDNTMYKIKVTTTTVTISLVNDMGVTIGNEYVNKVIMTDTTYGTEFEAINDNGTVKIDVIAGSYSFTIKDGSDNVLLTNASVITVPTTTSTTVMMLDTITAPSFASDINGQLAVIYTMGYQGTTTHISDAKIPAGTAGNAAYTIYSVNGSNVYLAKTNDSASVYNGPAVKVSGTLKDSNGNAVSGTIVFIVDGKQIPVTSGTDGKYSVMLPQNKTYTVYAQYSSEVSIEKAFAVEAAEITEKNISTATGTKVSGNVYWQSSINDMMNVPVTVTYDGVVYDLLTDSDGAYSMYIPADSTCTSIVANVGGTEFYFKDGTSKNATKTLSDSTGGTFSATVEEVPVTNNTGYKVELAGKTINNGDTVNMTVTSKTWSATVYDGDDKLLSSVSVPVSVRTLSATYFDIPDYTKVIFKDLAATDSISITQIANEDDEKGEYLKTGTANNKYFFEKGESDSKPFEYLVTVKNSDSTKIAYITLSLVPADTEKTVGVELKDKFTLSGYVGLSGTGKVIAKGVAVDKNGNSADYSVDTTDGTYKMVVPIKTTDDYKFKAEIETTEGSYKYNYEDERTISKDAFTSGEEYVRNFAVVSNGRDFDGDVGVDLEITSMTSSTIQFNVDVTNLTTEKTTYLLSGGSSWQEITFYNSSNVQISSVVVDSISCETVKAVGKIAFDKIGFGTENLSVTAADINGNASCTAVFEDSTNWLKTSYFLKSTIEYGSDAVGKSEYKYAVSITNKDNFAKTYTIYDVKATEGNIEDKWFVTYVGGNVISGGASSTGLTVLGYETATLYVKITVKDATSEKVPAITFKVKSETTDETFTVGENTEGGITMSDNVASVKSVEQNTLVKVTSMSADGRGVFNEFGSTPAYVWVLFGLVIVLTILVLWLGMKRGVFSRKK